MNVTVFLVTKSESVTEFVTLKTAPFVAFSALVTKLHEFLIKKRKSNIL